MNRLSGWLLLFLLLWVQGSTAGSHQQLPLSYAVANETFHPDRAADLVFSAYEPETRLPFADHPYGMVMRVQLPSSPEQLAEYNLVLRPKYLLEVTGWFKLANDPQWHSEKRGRLLANKPSYYSTQDIVYELGGRLDRSQPIYLVIRDNGLSKPLSVTLIKRQEYLLDDVAYSRNTIALYAVILVLALINLIFYAFIREKPFLLYSVYMVLALHALLWQEGWIGKIFYLPDSLFVDRSLHFFSMLPIVFFYWFYRAYLGLDRKVLGGKILLGFQIGFVAIIFLTLLDSFWSGMHVRHLWVDLFNGFLALGAVSVFVLTLRYWIQGHRLAGYLFVANFLLIGATLIRIAYAFNFVAENAYWQTHAFEIALAIDAILLSLALADRTLSIKKERDQAKVDLVRVDTAYQREQLLATFVRKLQIRVADDGHSDVSKAMDRLLFDSINRILPVAEVMVLTGHDGNARYRCLGGNRILGKLFTQVIEKQLPQLMKDCRGGLISRRSIPDFPDTRERYQCLLIPVKNREEANYCLLLLVPKQQYLDRDVISGLREFIEKAVHALMDAENVEQIRHSARHDNLTGVLNRASMEGHISRSLAQCHKEGKELALAFVDIDYFKKLNDTMGHDFGDDCLKLLCRSMQQVLPKNGLIGRFGGDEFLLLLPGLNYRHARRFLEKLNPLLASATENRAQALSVSIGIAECLSGQKMSMAELLKQADMSLYAAKAAGRACIGPRVANAKTGE
ncbi:sensor domain-containing diguanylate cyclase [Thiolapillus sp.]